MNTAHTYRIPSRDVYLAICEDETHAQPWQSSMFGNQLMADIEADRHNTTEHAR